MFDAFAPALLTTTTPTTSPLNRQPHASTQRRFQKTFVERQSWLVPIFHFWRVSATTSEKPHCECGRVFLYPLLVNPTTEGVSGSCLPKPKIYMYLLMCGEQHARRQQHQHEHHHYHHNNNEVSPARLPRPPLCHSPCPLMRSNQWPILLSCVSKYINQVYALHIFGLHLMIVGAKCQQDLGECSAANWGSTVITLYACSLIRVRFVDRATCFLIPTPQADIFYVTPFSIPLLYTSAFRPVWLSLLHVVVACLC